MTSGSFGSRGILRGIGSEQGDNCPLGVLEVTKVTTDSGEQKRTFDQGKKRRSRLALLSTVRDDPEVKPGLAEFVLP